MPEVETALTFYHPAIGRGSKKGWNVRRARVCPNVRARLVRPTGEVRDKVFSAPGPDYQGDRVIRRP